MIIESRNREIDAVGQSHFGKVTELITGKITDIHLINFTQLQIYFSNLFSTIIIVPFSNF